MSNEKFIKVILRDTENVIFTGDVTRISSFNEIGKFDIYPMHANFISIIKDELTFFKDSEILKSLKIESAVIKVKNNVANIYLGINELLVEDSSFNKKQ